MKGLLRSWFAPAHAGRAGGRSQLALRKAVAALLAALACVLLALTLGTDEPETVQASRERPLRPWEAKPQASLTLAPPTTVSLADHGAPVPAAAGGGAELVETSAEESRASVDERADGDANRGADQHADQSAPDEQAAALAQARPAPVDGYRIQLGVFADPANALALQQRLAGNGLPAGVQSRVVLGPFPDQQTARKAQAALRAAGIEEGMLVPPAKAAGSKAAAKKTATEPKP